VAATLNLGHTPIVDDLAARIGFALFVVGVGVSIAGLVKRVAYVRNALNPDSLPLWFRAEGLVLLGGSAMILGLILFYGGPWPFLIAVAIFSVAGVIFLRVRVRWW
jgi:hypothetical protein